MIPLLLDHLRNRLRSWGVWSYSQKHNRSSVSPTPDSRTRIGGIPSTGINTDGGRLTKTRTSRCRSRRKKAAAAGVAVAIRPETPLTVAPQREKQEEQVARLASQSSPPGTKSSRCSCLSPCHATGHQRTSSFTGDFASSGQVSPEVNTPASASSGSPPSTQKTVPVADGDTDPEAVAPIRKPLVDKMKVKTDVLKANHEERVLVVGRGVVLTANVTSCDKVIVEGQFEGNIKTTTFILSEGGHMEGEVRCCDGCIGGSMKATIIASKTLLIGRAAVVTGDMVYDSLQVVDGGRLQGKLAHYSTLEETEGEKEKVETTTQVGA